MKKQFRLSALVAAAAIAPAVLFSSPAVAAEAPSSANSASEQAAEATPDRPADKPGTRSEEEDRMELSRIISAAETGSVVRQEGRKAFEGTAQDVRRFLETGQYQARDTDNSIAITRLGTAKDVGPMVKDAARQALDGSPQDRVRFLETGWREAHYTDVRIRVTQIAGTGGPAVRAAARAALIDNSDAVIQHFLDVGQYEARAKDEAAKKTAGAKQAAHAASAHAAKRG
ncbi:ALF repeat-containing protein [Streptomyces sp. NPDC007100]|uniref:ALF repeat-containing protein n=1 Tax=unclassified Streptomyces TaxID=2593676 RepID=UPI0034073DD3